MQKTHKITRYLHKTTFKNLLVLHYCLTKNFILMKKLLMLSIVSVFTLSSFSTKEIEDETTKMTMRSWKIYCGGVYSGTITCDCNQLQAEAMGYVICYGNPF